MHEQARMDYSDSFDWRSKTNHEREDMKDMWALFDLAPHHRLPH